MVSGARHRRSRIGNADDNADDVAAGSEVMVQNILIALAGWMVLAVFAGLAMGNVMRHCAQFDRADVAPVRTRQLKKTA